MKSSMATSTLRTESGVCHELVIASKYDLMSYARLWPEKSKRKTCCGRPGAMVTRRAGPL